MDETCGAQEDVGREFIETQAQIMLATVMGMTS